MIRRPPRSTLLASSAASDVYKRQLQPTSDGLQPTRDGLQPDSDGPQLTSDGLQPDSDGLQPTSDGLEPDRDSQSRASVPVLPLEIAAPRFLMLLGTVSRSFKKCRWASLAFVLIQRIFFTPREAPEGEGLKAAVSPGALSAWWLFLRLSLIHI